MIKKGILTVAMAFACLAGSTQKANASFIAYICNDVFCTGGDDTIVTDQGPGDNFPGSATVGQINSGMINIGGFSIVTNVSQSKPLIGSATSPQLDLSFSAVTSDNLNHTVYLYASDTGFTGGGLFNLSLGGTQAVAGDGNTITGAAFGGNSNTNLDLSNKLAQVGPNNSSPFALSAFGSVTPIVNPFGLTIGLQIVRSTAGTTTGDLNLMVGAVPEPTSMALFGAALVGLGYARRRSKKA